MTRKRQVTIPKEVADLYHIEPGDEIEWVPDGSEIRVVPAGASRPERRDVMDRLAAFDRATRRRDERAPRAAPRSTEEEERRGWSREELHDRGRTR